MIQICPKNYAYYSLAIPIFNDWIFLGIGDEAVSMDSWHQNARVKWLFFKHPSMPENLSVLIEYQKMEIDWDGTSLIKVKTIIMKKENENMRRTKIEFLNMIPADQNVMKTIERHLKIYLETYVEHQ